MGNTSRAGHSVCFVLPIRNTQSNWKYEGPNSVPTPRDSWSTAGPTRPSAAADSATTGAANTRQYGRYASRISQSRRAVRLCRTNRGSVMSEPHYIDHWLWIRDEQQPALEALPELPSAPVQQVEQRPVQQVEQRFEQR